jgi:hypothetical protein
MLARCRRPPPRVRFSWAGQDERRERRGADRTRRWRSQANAGEDQPAAAGPEPRAARLRASMARTHPFAETGARPKPHATEGVTPASMPPATPAVEDAMLAATAQFIIGSPMSVPNPPADQFAPRPMQVREITPWVLLIVIVSPFPAARITRFLASVSGRAEPRKQRRPLLCRWRSRATGEATFETSEYSHRHAVAARWDCVERQRHGTEAWLRCAWPSAIGMAVLREKMAVEWLLNAPALSEPH